MRDGGRRVHCRTIGHVLRATSIAACLHCDLPLCGLSPDVARNPISKKKVAPAMPNCICGGHLEGGDHHVQRRATLRGNLNLMPFTNTTYLAPHALVTPAGFSGPAYLAVLPVPHIIITNIQFSIFNYLEGVAPALAGLCSIGSRRLSRLNPTPAFSCNYTGFLRSEKKRNAEVSSRCGHVNRNWRRRAKPCATRGRTIRAH